MTNKINSIFFGTIFQVKNYFFPRIINNFISKFLIILSFLKNDSILCVYTIYNEMQTKNSFHLCLLKRKKFYLQEQLTLSLPSYIPPEIPDFEYC